MAKNRTIQSTPPGLPVRSTAGIYQPENAYAALSLRDLLDARDQYHIHLMRHANVVATAIGYYRVRSEDSWPGETPVVKGDYARTLTNSQIRPYSWPAVLVFVEQWINAEQFGANERYDISEMVPRTLYLPDGRQVPVCIVGAARDPVNPGTPPSVRYPLNNIGSGHPILVDVQEKEHVATIACLVSDGHRVYALTNRHLTGDPGQILKSRIGGLARRIGVAARLQQTRVIFSELYPGWPGRTTYVNLDAGLIDIDDINLWTAKLKDTSIMGPMVDLSDVEFPLSLVGQNVCGYSAVSQHVTGQIHGLFYRYKSRGGFEYVADFFIGPRAPKDKDGMALPFVTQPGDSGTLWLLEPRPDPDACPDDQENPEQFRPLAVQWGANRLYSGSQGASQAYALATCVSTVCDRLDVDIIRDWNLDQPDTWGAVGHFAIASRVALAVSSAAPTLQRLMQNNAAVITHDDATILTSDFPKMGDDPIVPMADVPDFFWKHGNQGFSRPMEGPNHFADMDQPRDSDGKTLLDLCASSVQNVDPNIWNAFYSSVSDLLEGGPITQQHRGLLPFRVWQVFDELVTFVQNGEVDKFVCGAGVLAHYVGDSCQPLHVSYMFDGDPLQSTPHTVHHHDGTTGLKHVALGTGSHSAYEDGMVNANRKAILNALDHTPVVQPATYIKNGFEAAQLTVALMRNTLARPSLHPQNIIRLYVANKKDASTLPANLWAELGSDTMGAMQDGTHLLALLWESAWDLGGGETRSLSAKALDPQAAMDICKAQDFLTSFSVSQIGAALKRPKPPQLRNLLGTAPATQTKPAAKQRPRTPAAGNAKKKGTAKKRHRQ